jgi:hypothetical protein
MTEPEWKGTVLFSSNRVLGWIGYESNSQMWYARTSGNNNQPYIRGEFDNKESAKDFLQFITTVENT